MSRILSFAWKFVVLYLAIFLVFNLFTGGYYRVLAAGANMVFEFIHSPPRVTIVAQDDILYAFSRQDSRPIVIKQGYEFNFMLVLALFLATPNLKPLRKVGLTVWAAFLLVGIELICMVLVLRISLHVIAVSPGESPPVSLKRITDLVMNFQDVLPIMLWIVMGFRYFKGWLPVPRGSASVGRNEPCPCGSGLKYKKCCGKHA